MGKCETFNRQILYEGIGLSDMVLWPNKIQIYLGVLEKCLRANGLVYTSHMALISGGGRFEPEINDVMLLNLFS